MIGVLLQAVATFLGEISGSLGKWMVVRKEQSYFALGFQNAILGTAFFLVYVAINTAHWYLDPRSYPTLALLCVLEMIQGWATLKATVIAERSTFNFIRVGTMPATLGIDLLLGNFISFTQIIGITVVVIALGALFLNHGIDRKGRGLLIFTAVNSAVTLSLYKWHITHFNSVASEQIVLGIALLTFFFWGATRLFRENPLRLMARPHALIQSIAYAAGGVLQGFSYLYAPTSIIVTANRSFSALWAIVSGQKVFHEKSLALRLTVFAFIIVGIILIVR